MIDHIQRPPHPKNKSKLAQERLFIEVRQTILNILRKTFLPYTTHARGTVYMLGLSVDIKKTFRPYVNHA